MTNENDRKTSLPRLPEQKILKFFKVAAMIMCFAVLIIMCIGCKKQASPSTHKVVDSGIWALNSGLGAERTYWIDHERVIINSNRDMQPSGGTDTITVWNISTGEITTTPTVIVL